MGLEELAEARTLTQPFLLGHPLTKIHRKVVLETQPRTRCSSQNFWHIILWTLSFIISLFAVAEVKPGGMHCPALSIIRNIFRLF